jgi:hypothetical protein
MVYRMQIKKERNKERKNETSVMHFSFNLLRIKSLYMFQALLAHLQEALHKRQLVYCVCMSAGCGTIAVQLINRHRAGHNVPCHLQNPTYSNTCTRLSNRILFCVR